MPRDSVTHSNAPVCQYTSISATLLQFSDSLIGKLCCEAQEQHEETCNFRAALNLLESVGNYNCMGDVGKWTEYDCDPSTC